MFNRPWVNELWDMCFALFAVIGLAFFTFFVAVLGALLTA